MVITNIFFSHKKKMFHLLPNDVNPMVPETIQCSEIVMEKKRGCCCRAFGVVLGTVSRPVRGLTSIQIRRLVDHRIHLHMYFLDGRCDSEIVDLVTVVS